MLKAYKEGQTLYVAKDISNYEVFGEEHTGIFAAVGTECTFCYRELKPHDRYLCVAFEGQPPYGIHEKFFTDQKSGIEGAV